MKKTLTLFLMLGALLATPLAISQNQNLTDRSYSYASSVEKKGDYKEKLKNIVSNLKADDKKPYYASVNGKKVLLYEFSPRNTGIDFIVGQPKPKLFGYFIGKAKKEYNNLEFVTSAHFYDPKTGKLIGGVIGGGKKIIGIPLFNNTCLIYDDSMLDITNNGLYGKTEKEERRIVGCGFLELISEGKASKQAYVPDIDPYKKRQRSALAIKPDGNVLLLFTDSTISQLQGILKKLHVQEAIYLDSGNSRAFYATGKIYKRDNHQRKLVDVLVGYRK
ncbi:phosphodiester glycosidase family protein [Candidatus Pacearchaeota archaeon]|nr:phosphodiester glycosidase family protein [Candidatus Pacearchaeota archaeon]